MSIVPIKKELPAHIVRVHNEAVELSQKIVKLEAGLANSIAGASSPETELLKEQLDLMKKYQIVLRKRIALYE